MTFGDAAVQFVATFLGAGLGYWAARSLDRQNVTRAARGEAEKRTRQYVAALDVILQAIDSNETDVAFIARAVAANKLVITMSLETESWQSVRSVVASEMDDVPLRVEIAKYFSETANLRTLVDVLTEITVGATSELAASQKQRQNLPQFIVQKCDTHRALSVALREKLLRVRAIQLDPPRL